MTVAELIKELSELPGETLVVLSRDEEGNGFSPLAALDQAHYQHRSKWHGEVVEMAQPGSQPCVVLWPTN